MASINDTVQLITGDCLFLLSSLVTVCLCNVIIK